MYTIVLCLLSVGMILDFVENCFMVIVCLHISNLHVTRGVLCAQSRTSTMTMKHLWFYKWNSWQSIMSISGLSSELKWILSMQALTSLLQGQDGIPPRMFKSLIGTGHPEFASSRQQVCHFSLGCVQWKNVNGNNVRMLDVYWKTLVILLSTCPNIEFDLIILEVNLNLIVVSGQQCLMEGDEEVIVNNPEISDKCLLSNKSHVRMSTVC